MGEVTEDTIRAILLIRAHPEDTFARRDLACVWLNLNRGLPVPSSP